MSARTIGGRTLWSTRWGPLVVIPRAGLTWNAKTAYALRDANSGNARMLDGSLAFARARSVQDMHQALAGLGLPWVNTLAADRGGQAMYADVSVVPDLGAADLQRCAPSKPAAALRQAAGLVVLNGARGDCAWRHDSASPVPGLIPIQRMPVAYRTDWVHNSNDSFHYTHPGQKFEGISPMVGDTSLTRPRTRAGLSEIPEMLSRGKLTADAIQGQLLQNRNFMASVIVPDLLTACAQAPDADAQAAQPDALRQLKTVKQDNQGKWRRALSRWQIRVFESEAGPTLAECGYPLETAPRRLPLPLRALYRLHNALSIRLHRWRGCNRSKLNFVVPPAASTSVSPKP